MKLLVASDLSLRSEVALQRAVVLAEQLQAQITLLHVVDNELPLGLKTAYMQDANSVLQESLAQMQKGNSAVDVVVRVGDPFQTISEVANEIQADLIVVGSYRRQILKDTFVGTTAERVIRMSGRPVLMVNRKPEKLYKKTLLAVDLSPISEQVLGNAAKFGLLATTECSLAHAFVAVPQDRMAYAGPDRHLTPEEVEAARKAVLPDLEKLVATQTWSKGKPRLILEEGNAIKLIADSVQATGADILVLGVQGYGAVKRLLIGSVASKLLSQVDCDVLAVPFAD